MPRAVGEEAKEAKVKRRIRQKLHELGYDDADWVEASLPMRNLSVFVNGF